MPTTERYVRWQATSLAQFGFVNDLIIALAGGALAFGLTEVTGQTPFIGWSVLMLLVSMICGIGCAVNRLLDFRETAMIAKGKLNSIDTKRAKRHVEDLGAGSWRLFYCQLLTFSVGAILLVTAVASEREMTLF